MTTVADLDLDDDVALFKVQTAKKLASDAFWGDILGDAGASDQKLQILKAAVKLLRQEEWHLWVEHPLDD